MMKTLSHWGILAECETAGAFSPLSLKSESAPAAVVLTPAGELLIHREITPVAEVAIILAKGHGTLSEAQTKKIIHAFDTALALVNGEMDDVHLRPVPHSYRFSKGEYLTLEEWQSQTLPGAKGAGNLKKGDKNHDDNSRSY